MADRRPAARMQLVEVEDAPTAADRSRPADNPPPRDTVTPASSRHDRRARPAPVVARRWPSSCSSSSCPVSWPRRGTARSSLASPRCPAWSGPSTRHPSRCGRRARAPAARHRARGRRRTRRARRGRAAWTVTSHDAVSGAQRWSVDVAPVSSAGFEATAAVCPPLRGDVGDLVVCLVRHPPVLYSDDASIQEPPRVTVVPLSAQDGERLGDWEVRGTSSRSTASRTTSSSARSTPTAG